MILKELLEETQFKDIKECIQKWDSSKERINFTVYEELFEKLKKVPLHPPNNHMTIHVELTEDCGSQEYIWTATYSLYRQYTKKYSLKFASIEEIANAYIKEEEARNKEEYVTHILEELLYNEDAEVEELDFQTEERNKGEGKSTEYYSKEEILNSIDEEVFDE